MQTELLNTEQVRSGLLEDILTTADFRARKAEEWPDDPRNAASATALERLADYVRALPADDPRLTRLQQFVNEHGMSVEHGLCVLQSGHYQLSRFGFAHRPMPDTEAMDGLLTELTSDAIDWWGEDQ